MRGTNTKQASMLMSTAPETWVPATHPLRGIKKPWFLVMAMDEPSFYPGIFTKNRERLLAHDAAGEFFRAEVEQARGPG